MAPSLYVDTCIYVSRAESCQKSLARKGRIFVLTQEVDNDLKYALELAVLIKRKGPGGALCYPCQGRGGSRACGTGSTLSAETTVHLEHSKTKKPQVMELLLLIELLPLQLEVLTLPVPAILRASQLSYFIEHGNGLCADYGQIQCLR